jgi:hypothetical protein
MSQLILNSEERLLLANNADYASLGRMFRQFMANNKLHLDRDTMYAIVSSGVNLACYAAYMDETATPSILSLSFNDDNENNCIIEVSQIRIKQ